MNVQFILASASLASILVAAEGNCDFIQVNAFDTVNTRVIRLSENTPPGTVLETVLIHGNSTEITLFSEPPKPFGFNSTTRELVILEELDVDVGAPPIEPVIIFCWESGEPRASAIGLTLFMNVIDWNDNPPVFNPINHTVNVKENVVVDSKIYSGVVATDKDKNTHDNSRVTYFIKNGTHSDYLGVNGQDGSIILTRHLDYERFREIILLVVAKDNPTNTSLQESATATVTINILDVDDQKPTFSKESYSGYIRANATPYTMVTVAIPIHARDPDSMNVPIVYKIVDPQKQFAVNNMTAAVYNTRSIDRGTTSVSVGIVAQQTDNDVMEQFTLLTITIIEADTSVATFSRKLYEVQVLELVPNGTMLLETTITGPGQGNMVKYAITNGGAGFSINQRGQIILEASLDYEKRKQHLINITASDGNYTDTATVLIDVLDQNDNSPRILTPDTTFKLSSRKQGQLVTAVEVSNDNSSRILTPDTTFKMYSRKQGQLVTVIQATDEDVENKLQYHLRTHMDLFSINGLGELRVTATEDRLQKDEYSVIIVVKDNGTPPRETATSVTIMFPPLDTSTSPAPVQVASAVVAADPDTKLPIILGVGCGVMLVVIVLLLFIIFRMKRTKEEMNKARAPRGFIAQGLTYQKAESPDDPPKISRPVASAFGETSDFNGEAMAKENIFRPVTVDKGFIEQNTQMDRDLSEIEVETSVSYEDDETFRHSSSPPNYGGHLRTFQGDDSASSGSNHSDTTAGSGQALVNNNNNNNDGVGKMTSWDSDDKIHPQGAREFFENAPYSKPPAKQKSDRPEITVYF